jgi:hypothetical protein
MGHSIYVSCFLGSLDKWLYVAIGRNERHLGLKILLHTIKDNIINHCELFLPKVKSKGRSKLKKANAKIHKLVHERD